MGDRACFPVDCGFEYDANAALFRESTVLLIISSYSKQQRAFLEVCPAASLVQCRSGVAQYQA